MIHPMCVRAASRVILLAAACGFTAGCLHGVAESDGTNTAARAETRSQTAEPPSAPTTPKQTQVAERADAVAQALEAPSACSTHRCPDVRRIVRQARAVDAVVAPLNEELRGQKQSDPRLHALATSTSGYRHAVQELTSCAELSARQHDGEPRVEECAGPRAQLADAEKRLLAAARAVAARA